MLTRPKEVRKEFIVNELKELLNIVLYLAATLSLVATVKALVLIQLDINEFVHLYSVAIIEALLLGKVVALTQKLPIMNVFDNRSLIWSVFYKSVIMTIIVDIANALEDKLFPHSIGSHASTPLHPIVFLIAHQALLMCIFFVLYAARGLDRKLGHGTLVKMMVEK